MEDDPPHEHRPSPPPIPLTLTSSSGSLTEDELFEPISLPGLPNDPNVNTNTSQFKPRPSTPESREQTIHLVDSAIMGSKDAIKKLKSMASDDSSGDVSRSIINSLFSTMAGRADRISSGAAFVMQSSRAALVAAELIPSLSLARDLEYYISPRTRMVHGLLATLRACTRNRAMCSTSGLLRALLVTAEEVFAEDPTAWDGLPLCQCIQVLAGHSLPVIDLRFWLSVINKLLLTSWALPLTLALERSMESREAMGPAHSFEFNGETSGLLGPGENRWPFHDGYAFATWIYIESFGDSARLFSFLSSDDFGFEAHFHGPFLVVENCGGKGKTSSVHFSFAFKTQCWYFIGIEHSFKHGLLGKAESELRLYVDGNMHENHPFDFLRISKPLAFCCIGTNPSPMVEDLQQQQRRSLLFAEMGPVYVFKEPIGLERMVRLAARGGDTLPSFGIGAGVSWLVANEHMRNLADESSKLDAEIEGSLYLLYHPSLLSGRLCADASPSGAAGLHRRPAEVLGQVHVASRIRPAESLWALAYGGPMALLPLTVCNVQMDNLEPVLGDFPLSLATASLSAPIFRIISMAIQHPQNNEEVCRADAPELLSRILHYLLLTLSKLEHGEQNSSSDEELVAAIVSLCQSQKNNHTLKVQLFSTLLLDLKMWSICKYGLQKKLLSSLADMVFTESLAMRDANALQMLLDGCRRCYWVLHEKDSIGTFGLHRTARPIGEVNALVDELLVVVEVLVGVAPSSLANNDVRCLISFLVDSPQPNQVARVLHLIYRLIVQPNKSRADTFAQSFVSCGGVEALLVLLQREAKTGNENIFETASLSGLKNEHKEGPGVEGTDVEARRQDDKLESSEAMEPISHHVGLQNESLNSDNNNLKVPFGTKIERVTSSEGRLSQNLGRISFSKGAQSASINVFNNDNGDGVIVGMINLLGGLIQSGHLKFGSKATRQSRPSDIWGSLLHEESSTMFGDKVSLLLFALQKAFQAASLRLMTANVYMAVMGAAINVSSTDDGLNLYDYGHRFEHVELLLVLLRSLPYASKTFQARVIQDLLFLACSHPENRSCLTCMAEWPEWILEVFISNYEMGQSKDSNDVSIGEIEDVIHNFLIIMLEYSMRQKDGWKDVESVIHCAEWLCMVGGSSTGDRRIRREEAMPIFKRRLLGGLLDFATRELQVQTEVLAAAAARVAAEGLSPKEAKAGAEYAAQLTVALAENSIVILMLTEDHLRLQAQLVCSLQSARGSPLPKTPPTVSRSSSFGRTDTESFDTLGFKGSSLSSETGGLSLSALASMADANGQVSAEHMERLTAAAAAEPYHSVRCAFVCYGSCVLDLSEGWKYRSRLWYGIGLPAAATTFEGGGTTIKGGGSGWEPWKSVLEKDSNGTWIELPLVKKSIDMLQALLSDECGIAGGGQGTGMGGMKGLDQLLDSDQPFLCMLRMVLASLREDDYGEDELVKNTSKKEEISDGLKLQVSNTMLSDSIHHVSMTKPHTSLLWCVLTRILSMPVSESKRQRVLVASCILYSEVWHAIGKDGKPLRKQYIEAILPPFVAILKRWLPLLVGIHEFTSLAFDKPRIFDDYTLSADALTIEADRSMLAPVWAAAFASPPAAMALAIIAAGTAGGEIVVTPPKTTSLRRDSSLLERRRPRFHTFSSFQKPLEGSNNSAAAPKDKAAAKAAALAAARDLERNAKIGSGRGLSAVAMATSSQRRSESDFERAKRWNISEAITNAWTGCLQPFDSKSVSGKDFSALSYKYVAVLVTSFALSRNMQRMEMDRRTQDSELNRYRLSTGVRAWQKLLHCLIEMSELFGPFADNLCHPDHVFWKLDLTESSLRMRRFLKRKYKCVDHWKAAGDRFHLRASEKSNQIHANDPEALLTANLRSAASSMIVKAVSLEDNNDDNQQLAKNNMHCDLDSQERHPLSAEQPLPGSLDSRDSWAASDQDLVHCTFGVPPASLPSEADERIILELPSLMVRPVKLLQGNLQITTKRINFIIDVDIEDCSSDGMTSAFPKNEQDKNRSWLTSSLCQIFTRRYLLRKSALELFMFDRSNFFLDFGTIEGRKNAYRAIVQACAPLLKNIYLETQRPEQHLERTQLMERWTRWEISNFEYLMELNTLAGRSYNDITQYPVFPWVLADYCSNTLDLGNTSSYRDLSKPVGALNPNRLKKFQERYSSFVDPNIPKFHYSSHYSSATTVLYYLNRVEPFATLSAHLHGGKFDYSNMFSDINSTWNGVLEDMGDVKELVPEMFYLPEMLSGTSQHGGKLDSVKLPPWADNAVDFIYKHRMALESEHVSAHLHEWIDLIFGHKQHGEEAVSANNVFLYITYEGMVDIDKIEDPVQKHDTQDQITYFGQTPSQLMTVPHLKRKPLADVMLLQTIFRNPNGIKPHVVASSDRCNVPAAVISASDDSVIVVDLNAPSASFAVHKWQPNTSDGQGAPFLFHHGKPAACSGSGSLIRIFKGPGGSSSEDCHFPRALAFSAYGIRSSTVVAVTCDKDIITGGHADNSIKLISADTAKTIETACAHCAPVTCLSLSADSNYLVSGSRDTTVILWRIRRSSLHLNSNIPETSSSAPTPPTSPLVGSNISNSTFEAIWRHRIEGPIHVLRGHLKEVVCCCVNSDLGLIASCSNISGVLLHSIRRGWLVRKLDVGEVHSVSLSSQGIVLIWNKWEKKISTFTVNGIPIATRILSPFSGNISCIEISVDGENALIATSSCRDDKTRDVCSLEGSAAELNHCNFEETQSSPSNRSTDNRIAIHVPSICFLNLHSLKVFHTLALGDGQDVTAIGLNKENTHLFVSTSDKQLIVFTNPGAVEGS